MTTTNPYINNVDHNVSPEQRLVEDLVVESIKFYGHTFLYIPRTLVKEDEIFGEDTISRFASHHAIEMYIETVDGFSGEGDVISRFGLQIKDTATLSVAKRRFIETFEKVLIEYQTDAPPAQQLHVQPREGDLLYFPLTEGLFEITFVEHENPFYQVGKRFVFKLTIEQYEFSHEDFETGSLEVDQVAVDLENNNNTANDAYADNDKLETEGDALKEYSENNPFGDY